MSVLEFKADLATAHAKSAIDPTRTSQAVSDRFSGSRWCERPNLYSRDLDRLRLTSPRLAESAWAGHAIFC
jgi:hypothetical protein